MGQTIGGKNSPSKPKKPKLLTVEQNEELAEFFGILYGDGSCYEIPAKGIYQVRIFGHLIDDYEYMTKYVASLFKKLFKIELGVYFRKNVKVIILSKQSKDLVFTLKKFGFKSGNKKTNDLEIPTWILEYNSFLKAFLRGLIDTDGSVCPKTRNHKTPTIWFSSASPTLRKGFHEAFKRLGYKISVWTKKKRDILACSVLWAIQRKF